jgi:hypothetical protein
VSLGVGNGQKDRIILDQLQERNPDMIYVPVDMMPDGVGLRRLGPPGTHNRGQWRAEVRIWD